VPTGIVHVEDLDVAGHRQTHCVVTTNDGTADLRFDGRTIQFGDGYSIVRATLVNTPTAFVTRLTATSPGATTANAILARNLVTGETTSAGFDSFVALLRRSHDVRLAATVLPLVSGQTPSWKPAGATTSTTGTIDYVGSGRLHAGSLSHHFTVAPMEACLNASFTYLVCAAAVAATCGAGPEDPLCLVAVMALGGAAYQLATDCGTYNDNTIGWG